jgi:ethanolamine utilization protein EutA
MSCYAVRLLEDLAIHRSIGETLSQDETRKIVDSYVATIEAAAAEHARFSPVITLSGGVGELVYDYVRGEPLPATTAFGDLGVDLAMRLIQSPALSRYLRSHTPMNLGHATVYGLSLYGTQVSGTTLYLPDSAALPLRDLPIVARLRMDASSEDVRQAVEMAARGVRGACIEMDEGEGGVDFETVKRLGTHLAAALRDSGFSTERSLVLLVPHNFGKTLGSYASDWGRLPVRLIVIDELSSRNARFVSLGAARDNVVPVSFYGMH